MHLHTFILDLNAETAYNKRTRTHKGGLPMGIGTRLDALIRAKGTRPGTLAREAGVSKNTVYSII